MSDAPFTAPIQVRFRDLDAMGHVNNAVYITYLEMSRVAYWRSRFGDASTETFGVIIGQIKLRYLRPVELLDDPVVVRLGCPRQGNKSFDLVYEIVSQDGEKLFARAITTQVGYDYKKQRSAELGPAFRKALDRDAWTPDWLAGYFD